MPIRMLGMASGMPPNIVEQIMDAERIPIKQMESKKGMEDEKLKLIADLETKVGEITKSLGELTSTRGFTNTKLISGNQAVIDGVVDPEKAMTGDWQVEVVRLANKPGAMSNGFPDKDKTQVGVGYLRFDTPEGRKDVYVGANNSTLEGVANAVNASNLGLRASVINDRKDPASPFRLLVTGLTTGNDNQVVFPTIYMLDGDQDVYFEDSKPAQNAIVKLDGFELEVPDNQLKDIIPGVVLDLKQAAPGQPVRVAVKEDLEAIAGKIKLFVDAYNGALGFIQAQHKLSKGKDGKERLGPMGGDGMLRSIESNLRRVILNPQLGVDSSIQRVNELGIEFNRNGTLNFSQDKFNKKLSGGPKEVSNFFRGDGFRVGFVPTVKREIGGLLDNFTGPIGTRKKGIQSRIDLLDKRIDMKEKQLEKKEDQLRRKFSDLETKMSAIQAQGAQVAGLQAKPQ